MRCVHCRKNRKQNLDYGHVKIATVLLKSYITKVLEYKGYFNKIKFVSVAMCSLVMSFTHVTYPLIILILL